MSEVGKKEILKKGTFLRVIKKRALTSVTRKRGNIFGGGDSWLSYYPYQNRIEPCSCRALRSQV
jgi:hypothetical protein